MIFHLYPNAELIPLAFLITEAMGHILQYFSTLWSGLKISCIKKHN